MGKHLFPVVNTFVVHVAKHYGKQTVAVFEVFVNKRNRSFSEFCNFLNSQAKNSDFMQLVLCGSNDAFARVGGFSCRHVLILGIHSPSGMSTKSQRSKQSEQR